MCFNKSLKIGLEESTENKHGRTEVRRAALWMVNRGLFLVWVKAET